MIKSQGSITARRQYWGHALLFISLVYCVIPFALTINSFLGKYGLLEIFEYLLFALLIALMVFFVSRSRALIGVSGYITLALFSLAYSGFLLLIENPVERIHIVEYTIIACLVYRAISLDVKGRYAYALAFLATFYFGLIDELIQHVTPERYYDIRDLMFNATGGGLGLLFTFIIKKYR